MPTAGVPVGSDGSPVSYTHLDVYKRQGRRDPRPTLGAQLRLSGDARDGRGRPDGSHAVENPASGKVMMKAGFVYDHEAVYHKFDGTAIPCKCYALTREHYESLYSPNE